MNTSDQHTEVYPPPPPWYKLYRQDADGSAERPIPPLPPSVISGQYEIFGRIDSTAAGLPPLTVKQLFNVNAAGIIDFKGELLRLNRDLIFQFLELIDCVIQYPSSYARAIEAISTIFRNMHFLLNLLRSHQARASLEHILEMEIQERKEAILSLRKQRKQAEELLEEHTCKIQGLIGTVKSM